MSKIGKVVKVFLPTEEELTKVGFKIELDNELITIIEEQTIENANIYRDDFVFVEQNQNYCYHIKSINDIEIEDDIDE